MLRSRFISSRFSILEVVFAMTPLMTISQLHVYLFDGLLLLCLPKTVFQFDGCVNISSVN
jgi:hypothetical protein